MNLYDYFLGNTGRPIHKNIHYFPVYERHFAPLRGRPLTMLEIGAGGGGSSQMWKHYFGPAAQIVTIDIRPECKEFEDEQVAARIGDQSDPVFLQSLVDEFGAPDIVLDDGSHHMVHVNATFDHLYPRMPREALYMVEDLHTAYWPAWGGGLRKPGTFIERMKTLIDELHADNPHNASQSDQPLVASDISKITRSVHFYDSIVVLEKGAFLMKQARSIPLIAGQTIW